VVRLSGSAKRMLQSAALAQSKTISAFVLDSGMAAAEEALARRREFALPARDHERFLAALDAPVKAKSRLQRLLHTRGVLD
jgi:uncharacterized protein (DUF1778 family)